jgi:SAM-dependent methyltransferase
VAVEIIDGFATDGHLGGYIPGGDKATSFPELWSWLVAEQGVQSVLDVGCGEGHALDYFAGLGIHARGIDGIAQDRQDFIHHDFTWSPAPVYMGFDLVWCCEVVEHVEERYLPNLLKAFELGDLVLMTHAWPGQPGWHHVNCRQEDYWVGALAARGYQLDPVLTGAARREAAANGTPLNHFTRSGLAFRRYE